MGRLYRSVFIASSVTRVLDSVYTRLDLASGGGVYASQPPGLRCTPGSVIFVSTVRWTDSLLSMFYFFLFMRSRSWHWHCYSLTNRHWEFLCLFSEYTSVHFATSLKSHTILSWMLSRLRSIQLTGLKVVKHQIRGLGSSQERCVNRIS